MDNLHKNFDTSRENSVIFDLLIFPFQSQYASGASMAAIFRRRLYLQFLIFL